MMKSSSTPGLELLAVVLFGLMALVLFSWGLNIYKYATATHDVGLRAVGAILVVVPAVASFFMCRYWAKWVAPVSAYFVARSLFFLILGHTLIPPFRPMSRLAILAEIAVFLLIATVTYPYFHTAPKLLDRFFLSIFFMLIPCSLLLDGLEQLVLLLLGITPVVVMYAHRKIGRVAFDESESVVKR